MYIEPLTENDISSLGRIDGIEKVEKGKKQGMFEISLNALSGQMQYFR